MSSYGVYSTANWTSAVGNLYSLYHGIALVSYYIHTAVRARRDQTAIAIRYTAAARNQEKTPHLLACWPAQTDSNTSIDHLDVWNAPTNRPPANCFMSTEDNGFMAIYRQDSFYFSQGSEGQEKTEWERERERKREGGEGSLENPQMSSESVVCSSVRWIGLNAKIKRNRFRKRTWWVFQMQLWIVINVYFPRQRPGKETFRLQSN